MTAEDMVGQVAREIAEKHGFLGAYDEMKQVALILANRLQQAEAHQAAGSKTERNDCVKALAAHAVERARAWHKEHRKEFRRGHIHDISLDYSEHTDEVAMCAAYAYAENAVLLTAIRILLGPTPGAAYNAVREDYPELAKLVDEHDARLRMEVVRS